MDSSRRVDLTRSCSKTNIDAKIVHHDTFHTADTVYMFVQAGCLRHRVHPICATTAARADGWWALQQLSHSSVRRGSRRRVVGLWCVATPGRVVWIVLQTGCSEPRMHSRSIAVLGHGAACATDVNCHRTFGSNSNDANTSS